MTRIVDTEQAKRNSIQASWVYGQLSYVIEHSLFSLIAAFRKHKVALCFVGLIQLLL